MHFISQIITCNQTNHWKKVWHSVKTVMSCWLLNVSADALLLYGLWIKCSLLSQCKPLTQFWFDFKETRSWTTGWKCGLFYAGLKQPYFFILTCAHGVAMCWDRERNLICSPTYQLSLFMLHSLCGHSYTQDVSRTFHYRPKFRWFSLNFPSGVHTENVKPTFQCKFLSNWCGFLLWLCNVVSDTVLFLICHSEKFKAELNKELLSCILLNSAFGILVD